MHDPSGASPPLSSAQSLTELTKRHIATLFPGHEDEIGVILMAHCGNNLPFLEHANGAELERVRFAALKLSRGRKNALFSAIELAKVDWRDLLMAAGFGEDAEAHHGWCPEPAQEVRSPRRRSR